MDVRTAEILHRFKSSWTETKDFYDKLITNYPGWDKLNPVRAFIDTLEEKGEDNYFRLGTSVDRLLISRSVDHGLRVDQKYIKIEAIAVNDFEVTLRNGDKIYRQYRISDLNDERLGKLLQTLKHTLVD
jgi:hypothetical protein